MKSRQINKDSASTLAQKIAVTRVAPIMQESIKLQGEILSAFRDFFVNNAAIESAASHLSALNPSLVHKVEGMDTSQLNFSNGLRRSIDCDGYASGAKNLINCLTIGVIVRDAKVIAQEEFYLLLEPGETAWTRHGDRQIRVDLDVGDPLGQKVVEFTERNKESFNAVRSLAKEIRANIERARTTTKLIEMWPEVKDIVLEHYEEVEFVETPLSAIVGRHVPTMLAAPNAA